MFKGVLAAAAAFVACAPAEAAVSVFDIRLDKVVFSVSGLAGNGSMRFVLDEIKPDVGAGGSIINYRYRIGSIVLGGVEFDRGSATHFDESDSRFFSLSNAQGDRFKNDSAGLSVTINGVTTQLNGPRSGFFRFGPGAGVPEPAAWALMIGGFGMAGAAARRRGYQLKRL
jgi:hypothetical protein